MSFLSDILGPIGAILGIGAGAKSLFGGSQQGGSGSANTYVPTGLGAADQTFQDTLAQLEQLAQQSGGQLSPILLQGLQQMLGIPTSGLTQGAQQASELYQGLIPQAQQAQQLLGGAAGQGLNQAGALNQASNQVFQTSLDPQNALRDKLMNQVGQASRLSTGERGIGMSPLAADLETQAKTNFGMDWENQQLQRQVAGLGGMTGASNASANQLNQAGRDITGSLTLGEAAPGYAMNSGITPFNAAQTAAQLPFTAAQEYGAGQGQIMQPYGNLLSAIIPYLNSGQGATGQSFLQGQVGLNNLTSGLYQLGKSPGLSGLFGGNQGYGDPNSMYYGGGGGGGDTTYGPS